MWGEGWEEKGRWTMKQTQPKPTFQYTNTGYTPGVHQFHVQGMRTVHQNIFTKAIELTKAIVMSLPWITTSPLLCLIPEWFAWYSGPRVNKWYTVKLKQLIFHVISQIGSNIMGRKFNFYSSPLSLPITWHLWIHGNPVAIHHQWIHCNWYYSYAQLLSFWLWDFDFFILVKFTIYSYHLCSIIQHWHDKKIESIDIVSNLKMVSNFALGRNMKEDVERSGLLNSKQHSLVMNQTLNFTG